LPFLQLAAAQARPHTAAAAAAAASSDEDEDEEEDEDEDEEEDEEEDSGGLPALLLQQAPDEQYVNRCLVPPLCLSLQTLCSSALATCAGSVVVSSTVVLLPAAAWAA
jgi:hypothetical protein